MKYILAYDLGTGGTKASVYNEEGKDLASVFIPVKTYFPSSGFHEQRPDDWWQSVVNSTRQLISKHPIPLESVAGLAVSGHSLGAVPISTDGKALTEYTPIWTDGRGAKQAKRFFESIDETSWYKTTGNGFPSPQYPLFKIMWLKDNASELYEKTVCFLGTKDYVNYRLTGVMATDHSYASGSGCYDLRKMSYCNDYIKVAQIDKEKLPKIYESASIIGNITAEAAKEIGLLEGVPVAAGGVDNACMALGAACISDGDAYTSLGTSAWTAVTSHEPIVNSEQRSYVFAHCIPGMFASATCIFSAGNSLRWVKNNLCQDLSQKADSEGVDVYDLITELAEKSPVGAKKLMFNPSLAGGSSTDKSTDIKGGFIGLTLGHNREDVLRSTLEGVALSLRLSLDVLRSLTPVSGEMLIVGGGGKSAMWRQIFANAYNMNILETNVGETAGSLGAMACAAVATGLWENFDVVHFVHHQQEKIVPQKENVDIYNKILPVFKHIADVQADLGDELAQLSY